MRLVSTPKHDISIIVDGVEIKGFDRYEIRVSMTDPADTFTVSRPFLREMWDLCVPDRRVQILIDGVPVITGRIDDLKTGDENTIEINGRCNIGRLFDDCAPTVQYGGIGIKELITNLASPFFPSVTFTNVRDRTLRRGGQKPGKGKLARAGNEPAVLRGRKKDGTQIEPGQTRWQTIQSLCEQSGLLAWSSGDGKELVVSLPNYDQEIQFGFFRPAPISRRAEDGNVLSMELKRTTGDRYSRIIIVGSGAGTTVNFGAAVSARFGDAKNNEASIDGDGIDFTAPKRLIIQRSIASMAQGKELAEREMAKRDTHADVVTVKCAGHGQRIARAFVTLFAPDLLALVEDERTGTKEVYAITSCTYSQTRTTSAETTMELVRKGSVLA